MGTRSNPLTGRVVLEYCSTGSIQKIRRAPREAQARVVADVAITAEAPALDDVIASLATSVQAATRLSGVAERLHVSSEDTLTALEMLASSTPAGAEGPASTLTLDEERALREAGSLREELPPLAQRASLGTAMQRLVLVTDALSVKQAAATLEVSEGRIRQRLAARTLFGVQAAQGWRLPRFQFTQDGQLLRGLDRVLPALPADVHPVVVTSFLARPHEDLLVGAEPTSPAAWLEGGGDIDAVVTLAASLHDLP